MSKAGASGVSGCEGDIHGSSSRRCRTCARRTMGAVDSDWTPPAITARVHPRHDAARRDLDAPRARGAVAVVGQAGHRREARLDRRVAGDDTAPVERLGQHAGRRSPTAAGRCVAGTPRGRPGASTKASVSDKEPFRAVPIAVRHAETMTASGMDTPPSGPRPLRPFVLVIERPVTLPAGRVRSTGCASSSTPISAPAMGAATRWLRSSLRATTGATACCSAPRCRQAWRTRRRLRSTTAPRAASASKTERIGPRA